MKLQAFWQMTEPISDHRQVQQQVPGVKSAGRCLPGAPRLWVLDTVRLSTIIGPAFSYQSSAVKLFTSPKFNVDYPRHLANSGSVNPLKINQSFFVPASRATTIRKTVPTASEKRQSSTPKSIKRDVCGKGMYFAMPSNHKSVQKKSGV